LFFYLDLNPAPAPAANADTYVIGTDALLVQPIEWFVYPVHLLVWIISCLDNIYEPSGRQFVLGNAVCPLLPYGRKIPIFHEQRAFLVIVGLDVGVGTPYALMDDDLLALLVVDFDAVLDVVDHFLDCIGVRWLTAFLAQVGEDVLGEIGRKVVVSGHVFGLKRLFGLNTNTLCGIYHFNFFGKSHTKSLSHLKKIVIIVFVR